VCVDYIKQPKTIFLTTITSNHKKYNISNKNPPRINIVRNNERKLYKNNSNNRNHEAIRFKACAFEYVIIVSKGCACFGIWRGLLASCILNFFLYRNYFFISIYLLGKLSNHIEYLVKCVPYEYSFI
jgi:hypothetical protein